jgi:hypothetical protein
MLVVGQKSTEMVIMVINFNIYLDLETWDLNVREKAVEVAKGKKEKCM